MGRKIGLVLILGIFGAALLSLVLILWMFVRAINEPSKPAPKAGVVLYQQQTAPEYIFVDGRVAGPSSNFSYVSYQPTDANLTFDQVAVTTVWATSASSV